MAKRNATPANFTFLFIAADGYAYPVTVEFLRRLPIVSIIGFDGAFTNDFRHRALMQLHTVLPRMRVVLTIDDSAIPSTVPLVKFHQERAKNLRASGANLADQLFIALQARKF